VGVRRLRPRTDQARDRGEATVQLVILTPILLLLLFLGIQAAIYFHAANVAGAAAAEAAAAGSTQSGGSAAAITEAMQTVNDLNATATRPPSAIDANGYVVVTVEISVPRIVPFFPASVSRTAREPKERFVPESDR
jgi:Flp pilus assembly protein TadG